MVKEEILKSARALCQKRHLETSKADEIYKVIQDRAIILALISLLPLSIFEFVLLLIGVDGIYSKINSIVRVPFWRGRLHILTSSFVIRLIGTFIIYFLLGVLDWIPGINIFSTIIAVIFNYYIVRSYGYLYVKSLMLLDASVIKDTNADKRAGIKVMIVFAMVIAAFIGCFYLISRTTFNHRDYKRMDSPSECVVPDTYKRVSAKAFSDKDELRSITLPTTIRKIGARAFQSCDGLTSVVLPDSIRQIKSAAFRGCDRLKYIKLPSNLEVIPSYMFLNCDVLSEIVFPENLKAIKNSAFHNCDGIVEIVLPAGLQEIGDDAFRGCEKLRSVTIPASLVNFGYRVFFNSRNLDSIKVSRYCPAYYDIKSKYSKKVFEI